MWGNQPHTVPRPRASRTVAESTPSPGATGSGTTRLTPCRLDRSRTSQVLFSRPPGPLPTSKECALPMALPWPHNTPTLTRVALTDLRADHPATTARPVPEWLVRAREVLASPGPPPR